jgi:hypothetical protein
MSVSILPVLWSVVVVETSGCGFLPDRRPRILFERRILVRWELANTSGRRRRSPVTGAAAESAF